MYFSTVFWSQVEIEREYFAPSAFKYFRRSWYLWGGALGKKLNFNRIISDLLLAEFNQNYSTKAEGFLGFSFFLAAGVERESEEEKSFGDFIIESNDSPYRTLNFTFEPYDFSRLVEVNRYNVLNNKDTLLKTLNLALQRRKLKKVTTKSNTWAVSKAEDAERLPCTKAVRFKTE